MLSCLRKWMLGAFLGDIKVPMLIVAPTKRRMAPLDRQDSQRELQAKVKGSKAGACKWSGP